MIRRPLPAAALLALAVAPALPAHAAPGGPIGTLPLGIYRCELPGDALGPAGVRQPAHDFAITHASSYRVGAASGIYLLTGDRLVFTSGPLQGVAYHRTGEGALRLTAVNGTDADLRCVRAPGSRG